MPVGRRLVALLLLIIPVAALLAGCHSSRNASAPAEIGREVIDGEFAFVVTHVETSPMFNNTHAQGVYLVVSMAVRNVGTEPQFFVWGAQKLKDSTGRKYSARFMDPSRIGDVGDSIDPGLQVSVRLAFDVPDPRSTTIVLHDSPSSEGVAVHLKRPAAATPAPGDNRG
jgi:Domain of unknown function (DUF4352)